MRYRLMHLTPVYNGYLSEYKDCLSFEVVAIKK